MREFIRFCLVGISNTLINYGIFAILLRYLHVPYLWAGSMGFLAGAIWGFFLNRYFTFQSSAQTKRGLPIYLAINLFSLLINLAMQWLAVDFLAIAEIWSQLCGIVVTTFTNFILVKLLIFKPQPKINKN